MKIKKINIAELILLIIMVLGIIYSIFESEILDHKLYLTLFIILPFALVLLMEIIKIDIEPKDKKNIEIIEEEKIKNIAKEENVSITETVEKTIEKKEQPKKEKKSEDTIQIPINEIKKEIESLNKKLNKEEDDLEKTEVLFSKGDLKEIIEKELTDAKIKSKKNKSTKPVDKPKTKKEKSTESVDKSKNKKNKSTKSVDK